MFDRQQAFNNQVSDFLAEFKHRFSVLNHSGMPGKLAYSSKLNRTENSSLNIYLTDKFPLDAPMMFIIPKFSDSILDDTGRVKDTCVTTWNVHSTLVSAVRTVLLKLEGSESALGLSSMSLYGNKTNNNNMGNYNNNFNNYGGNMGMSMGYGQYQNNYNNQNSQYPYNMQQNNNQNYMNYNNNTNTGFNTNFNNSSGNQKQNNPGASTSNINYNMLYSNSNNNMMGGGNTGGIVINNTNISDFNKQGGGDNSYNSSLNIPNNNFSNNSNNSGTLVNDNSKRVEVNLESELNSKSLEELIYIFHNQEEFVQRFMDPFKGNFNELKNEVNLLAGKRV